VLSSAAASVDAQTDLPQTDLRQLTRNPTPWLGQPQLLMEAPGSKIGATVRDLRRDEARGQWLWHGVAVERVAPDSPASRAGLMTGDIIIELDQVCVGGAWQFERLLHETPPGHEIPIAILRKGLRSNLTVKPEMAGS
jgi:S1-C subfamily serine protease